jgi:hypothetical protein
MDVIKLKVNPLYSRRDVPVFNGYEAVVTVQLYVAYKMDAKGNNIAPIDKTISETKPVKHKKREQEETYSRWVSRYNKLHVAKPFLRNL